MGQSPGYGNPVGPQVAILNSKPQLSPAVDTLLAALRPTRE
jgi:hypothetical protein